MLKTVNSIDETMAVGKELAGLLRREKLNIFLTGGLGAGKTTLIKGIGEGLGIKDRVQSPSFQLVRKYGAPGPGSLTHIDLYRLKDAREILELGWWDLLEEEGVTAVEWADRAREILPDGAVFLSIRMLSETSREIEYEKK
ncbi:MAG: tRNA (adenosine(37)-N6)-threonylcarbamoyltransferase complex ATPase subunit type 1 TsaE [Elusimicrobia bacterium]|nr:tRNA (adenosine(37)-N6)-threonylcarbamoyltransferase complex ATPase subunit type 1 TsaE [Elusimicrobiota bacterium]